MFSSAHDGIFKNPCIGEHVIVENKYKTSNSGCTLAGGRSQFAIASESGAQVATDILTLWNGGADSHVHDKA